VYGGATGRARSCWQVGSRTGRASPRSWQLAARGSKINSSDPPLPAVCTAYPTPPFPPFLHPPVQLASLAPCGGLHRDWWINFPAIYGRTLLQVVLAKIHI
jgi:hypothetical protein